MRKRLSSGPLAIPEFRRLWAGVLVTQLGDWLQLTALGWYVVEIGGTAAQVTGVAAAGIFPQLLFTLLGGVAADRWPKRHVLTAIVYAQFGVAIAFASLVAAGALNPAGLALFAFVLGSFTAIWQPVYLAYISDLVPPEGVQSAMGLSMSAVYTARTVGPALAGVLIATVGTVPAFYVNALTFLAPLIALHTIQTLGAPLAKKRGALSLLAGGVNAVVRDPVLLPLWMLTAGLSLLALPIFALLPIFVQDVFKQGALTFGGLLTAAGLGQLLGATTLALATSTPQSLRRTGLHQLLGYLGMGLALLAFSQSNSAPVATVALFLFSFVHGLLSPKVNAIVHSRALEERGTAQALFLLVFGFVPLGQLLYGWAAVRFGPVLATTAASLGFTLLALVALLLAPALRRYTNTS